jgi:hypothetical protein
MTPDFAAHVAADLRATDASESEIVDYEYADPSFMAVTAASRYWRKRHPEEVGLPNEPRSGSS